ncbi:hypothetical protein H6P81_012504 [Aristolochia fimbriata]|uniref:Uncharacterized protein n=1 Tax=Aristolochia fimbriata TaxID=158543 RepID=A0AAV7EDA4_ARIFI|nr:hypothetical protein H6P81_012504 [Aristolochia fimbriata]
MGHLWILHSSPTFKFKVLSAAGIRRIRIAALAESGHLPVGPNHGRCPEKEGGEKGGRKHRGFTRRPVPTWRYSSGKHSPNIIIIPSRLPVRRVTSSHGQEAVRECESLIATNVRACVRACVRESSAFQGKSRQEGRRQPSFYQRSLPEKACQTDSISPTLPTLPTHSSPATPTGAAGINYNP